jgi:iron complex outermembrane receptor protein
MILGKTGFAALLGLAVLMVVVPVSRAQAPISQFDFPSQPLAAALRALGSQTSTNVLFDPPLVEGRDAPALKDELTLDQAFARVLAGSGLTHRFLDEKTVMIISVVTTPPAMRPVPSTPADGSRRLAQTAQADPNQSATGSQSSRSNDGRVAASTTAQPGDRVAEIVVTGSRIQRPGYTSPTPVTTLDASAIEQGGQINIASLLNDIPAFRASTTEQSSSQTNTALGANYADLRGLGSMRTLVLMNGQRFVPQIGTGSGNTSNQVDLNVFPAIAIQRVDVVTGGASSAWGSDAVAGVVNLQMYERYQGAKVDVQHGVSSRGDNETNAVQLLAGRSVLQDRARFVLAGAWSQNDGVADISHRPWWGDHVYIMPDPTRCANCYLAGSQWQNSTNAPGGVITSAAVAGGGTSSALNNIAFGIGGVPYNMPQGYFRSGSNGIFGGTVPDNYDGLYVPFKAPSQRTNFYGNFDFDFTHDLTGHVTVSYSDRHARNFTNAMVIPYTILTGNPFIPASIQARMTALNLASITLGVKQVEILTPPAGENGYQVNGKTRRISAGFDWQFGASWKLDGYAAYGDNHSQNFAPNQRNFANVRQASDAVVGPNGAIVCRNPANGCVPINIFGVGSPAPAALDFITSDQEILVDAYQRVVAVNLSGAPFDTWAGPISVAAGAEYRRETKGDTYDALTAAGALNANGAPTLNFAGELSVREGYVETAIPLLSGVRAVKSLELNAAYRGTDYSTVGSVDTWKAGVIWKVTDSLLFRGTMSRDIRAPTITELFFPQTRGSSVTIPGQAELADFFNGGNPALKPEVADARLFGLTFRPGGSFGATIDYYDVRLADVITSASQFNIVNACIAGDATACAQWVRDPVTGKVTRLVGGFSNISAVEMKGVDSELFWSLRLGNLPGKVDLRLQGTWSAELNYQLASDQPMEDYAGQNSRGIVFTTPFYVPTFRGALNVGYSIGGFGGAVVAHYVSAGVNDHLITTMQFAANDIAAYWNFDLNLGYKFGSAHRFQIYGNVRNLFDREPAFAPNNGLAIPTSPTYDTVGRTYAVGFRYLL